MGWKAAFGILLLILTFSAIAYPGEVVIEGVLSLAQMGQVVGAESFALFRAGSGYLFSSRGRLSTPQGEAIWEMALSLAPDLSPRGYELVRRVKGGEEAIRVRFPADRPGRAEIAIHRDGEREAALALAGKNWLVLDKDVVSHFVVLALVLYLHGGGEFTALVPQARAAVPLAAEPAGLAAFHAPWGEEVGRRWRLELGGEEVVLYEHAGDFLWAEVPGDSLAAWRSDLFGELPRPYRIQTAAALPTGAREEEVRFRSGEVELAGTFLRPPGEGPFPAILFIPGTGEVDRDGSAPGKPAALFRELAYCLAGEGLASLRYDKRGVGKSTGDLSRASMSDLLSDAGTALSWLLSRPEVEGVFIVGHSEGALHALSLAGEPGVAGLVLLGAPGREMGEVLLWQLETALRAAGAPEDRISSELEKLREFISFAHGSSGDWEDYTPAELRAALPSYTDDELADMRKTSLRWWREALGFDPVAAVREAEVPLLVLSGGADVRVPPGDAPALVEAARAAGNPDARGIVVPEMNHWLRFQPGRSLPEIVSGPLDPRAVEYILAWLSAHTGR